MTIQWEKKNLKWILSNGFKSIVLETDQRIVRLFWEEQQKYLQSFQNNAIYHPVNTCKDVMYQIHNFFSSDKCFVYFISAVPHLIWWNQHNTAVYSSSQNSTLLSINELTFNIMKIQNNQSLKFEWKAMLASLRSVKVFMAS